MVPILRLWWGEPLHARESICERQVLSPNRQISAVGLSWLLPGGRLPDQPPHHFPGEQRLGHISLDERPAVDHLVLLQARVPLPDLVHPYDPVVMPLVR